jgi:ABC-type nitrate/sulfonate/bicarbonate transport system ATPase subunit
MPIDIEARDVWKSYRREDNGALPVLEGFELDVAQHEFVTLVGPSGCGKSTLLDLLAGFQRPDRGSIKVAAKPVGRPSPKGILITQKGSVFPWISAWRNLTLVLEGLPEADRTARARHYLELVGLQDFALAFPYQLSGGMLQRLELARALVVKPEVLYMDEPFGSLDALARLRMRQELLRIRREEPQTTVLVTHDVDEAIALADRIFVLSERPMRITRIVAVDVPHPRSIADPGIIALKESILRDLGAISE